ncbi:putative MFS family arabinose efflux permease [Bradyrhizobium sp. GM2.4]
MSSADRPATRLATRLAFLVAGFGMACWAPLVPFAKARLAVDDGILGLLLLSLGIGSVVAMLLTGVLSARYGSKPIIMAGGIGLALVLPLLTIANSPAMLALALLAFGAALGSIDVAMNIHAVEVERAAGRPLMSGFHALFSIGGFAGAALMTALLSLQLGALACTLICSVLMLIAMLGAWPRLLRSVQVQEGPLFVLPHGAVLLLALLCAITFLVEGAMLDWGALLVIGAGLVSEAQGGIGYIVFSVAMTIGRLGGDAVVARIGDRTTLFWGSLIAIAGFVVLLTAPVGGGRHRRLPTHRPRRIQPRAGAVPPSGEAEGDANGPRRRGDHDRRLRRRSRGPRRCRLHRTSWRIAGGVLAPDRADGPRHADGAHCHARRCLSGFTN